MNHPFLELKSEYENLLAIARALPDRAAEVDQVAKRLLRSEVTYSLVAAATTVPAVLLAALNERESSGSFATYLGNGEPLDRVTRLVPKGRGPFVNPNAWEKGAIDAVNFDHLNDLRGSNAWTWPYACWKGEAWNGFGPRNHGKHTGYLWGGTQVYDGGKYVADNDWDPNFKDTQIGIIPIMQRMIQIAPELQFAPAAAPATLAPSIVPPPAPAPVGVGGNVSLTSTQEIQRSLNQLGYGALLEDGNYGRRTREQVRAFQREHGLDQDGLAGPLTISAMRGALAGARA